MNEYNNLDNFKDNRREINTNSDTIILVVVVWFLISRLIHFVFPLLMSDYYSSISFQAIFAFTSLVWALIPIALSFTVKNKSTRQVVLIIAIILACFSLYEIASRFI